ncbi:MAG: DUF411 domain-containing protein [Gemmatimonadota bacterium]
MSRPWKTTAWSAGTLAATFLVLAAVGPGPARPGEEAVEVTVYKSATCGCCQAWVEHLAENGFEVKAVNVADLAAVKAEHTVPPRLAACHTAVVDGYVVEGHVPAEVVRRLLEERPEVLGIAVPGMPVGSPGMEAGDRKDPYDVLTFDAEGRTTVFERR